MRKYVGEPLFILAYAKRLFQIQTRNEPVSHRHNFTSVPRFTPCLPHVFTKIEIHILIEFLLHGYRFHGSRIAEMPLIATDMARRGQGVCKELMRVIESVGD